MPESILIPILLLVVGVVLVWILIDFWEEILKKILIVAGIIFAFNLISFIGFLKSFIILGIVMAAINILIFIFDDGKDVSSEKKEIEDSEYSFEEEESRAKKRYDWAIGYRKADTLDWKEKRTCSYCKNYGSHLCPQGYDEYAYDDTCRFFESL